MALERFGTPQTVLTGYPGTRLGPVEVGDPLPQPGYPGYTYLYSEGSTHLLPHIPSVMHQDIPPCKKHCCNCVRFFFCVCVFFFGLTPKRPPASVGNDPGAV